LLLLALVAGVSGRNANGKTRLWKDEMTELVALLWKTESML